jgi:hypothetical protein
MVWYDIPDIFCQDCVAIMRDLDCTATEAAGGSDLESLSYCKETRYPSSSICVLYGMIYVMRVAVGSAEDFDPENA